MKLKVARDGGFSIIVDDASSKFAIFSVRLCCGRPQWSKSCVSFLNAYLVFSFLFNFFFFFQLKCSV